MMTFNIRALILTAPLLCSTLAPAMQGAPQMPADGDMPKFSYKEMVSIAHNQLAWQKYAGKTVGIYGARFLSIQPFANHTYMMNIVSSPYTSDVSQCMLAKESEPVAANFKLHDEVSIIVKLAPDPTDRGLPHYDSPCIASPAAKKVEVQAAPAPDGPLAPAVIVTAAEYFADGKNSVAVSQKYLGKAVQVTGKVGNVNEKYVEVDVFMYNRDIPVMNCFPNSASVAKLGTLTSGHPITAIGTFEKGDFLKAHNSQAILSNCTIK